MTNHFRYRRIRPDDIRKPFDCGDADLTDFFLKDSAGHARQLLAVTYTLENDAETIAFFSVLNDRIQKEECDQGIFNLLAKMMPSGKRYGSYPAVKVGRLGVHKVHQHKNIGTDVMNYIKMYFVDERQKTGCRFITVDAYNNECTVKFYLKNGFQFLTDQDKKSDHRAMYFDLMPIANYIASAPPDQ